MIVETVGSGMIYGTLLGAYSGFPVSGAHFGVFVMATANPTLKETSKGVIHQGERTSWGDRYCEHMHLEGHLYAVPNVLSTKTIKSMPFTTSATKWNPSSSIQTVYTYIDTYMSKWTVVGPVSINTVPSYRYDFPDTEEPNSYRRNIYHQVISDGKNFERIIHYEIEVKATHEKVIFHDSKSYEVDFPNRKYRVKGSSSWSNLPAICIASVQQKKILPVTRNDYLRLFMKVSPLFIQYDDPLIIGDLVRRCANDAQVVQTNSIALIKDLSELSSEFRKVLALVKGRISPKTIAKGFLSYKYGMRLTVQDLRTIAHDVEQELQRQHLASRKVHASNVVTRDPLVSAGLGSLVSKYTYTIRYRPYSKDWRRNIELMWDAGLFPSLQNSWDLIPFSFVVDWFTQVGDRLNAADAKTYWSLFDILGCCSSKKSVYTDVTSMFSTSAFTLIGDCSLHCYVRTPSPSVCLPSYFVDSPREFRNYAEALALIVANKRH